MEVKSLLEKIDNSSKRRLYRVGCDDEINKLYNTIDEVTSKLKDKVRSIDTIMYHLKNNNYAFKNTLPHGGMRTAYIFYMIIVSIENLL